MRDYLKEAEEKFQEGSKRLQAAGTDPILLGTALLSLHGCVEDLFRGYLYTAYAVDADQIDEIKTMGFPDLCKLMQERAFPSPDSKAINILIDFNSRYRIPMAHGRPFPGTLQDVQEHARITLDLLRQYHPSFKQVTIPNSKAQESWLCPVCQTPNAPNRKHCEGCGRDKEQARREAQGLEICPSCSKFENKKSDRFCGSCGTDIPKYKNNQRITTLACGCVGAVVLLICLAAGIMWGYQTWLSPAPIPTSSQVQAIATVTSIPATLTLPAGWSNVSPPIISVSSLAVDPTNGKVVYAGTSGQYGVFKTTDAGNTWIAVNNGLGSLDIRSVTTNVTNPAMVFAIGRDGKIWITVDGGKEWTYFKVKATYRGYTKDSAEGVRKLITIKSNQILMYGIMSLEFSGYGGEGVVRSEDGGKNWTVTQVLNEGCDIAVGSNPSILYFFQGAQIYKSADSGKSWLRTANIGANYTVRQIAIDMQNSQMVYAGTGMGVYKSIDGGGFWSAINMTLPDQGNKLETTAILADPVQPNTVYAAFKGYGIYMSTDAGQTWKNVFSPATPVVSATPRIRPTFTPRSAEGNLDFSLSEFTWLASSPASPRYLYAGGNGIGVWRFDLP